MVDEQNFIVHEQLGGLKKNKEYLSLINDGSQNPFVTTLAIITR
jgi:hypothetical protein